MKFKMLLALSFLCFSSAGWAEFNDGSNSKLGDIISADGNECMHNMKVLLGEHLSGPLMVTRAERMCTQAMGVQMQEGEWIYAVESREPRVINCFICHRH